MILSASLAYLIFFVKTAFISVCPEEQPSDPRWHPPQLFADCLKAHTLTALNDDFIMHMRHDSAIPQCFGITEDVPADCLHDVLHKLRSVLFKHRTGQTLRETIWRNSIQFGEALHYAKLCVSIPHRHS